MLALEERQFRVEVGYGLEGILPDAKTGRIQDIIPYLKQNNWNDGIKNGFSAFLDIVASEYNVEVEAQTAITTKYTQENGNDLFIKELSIIPFISGIVGAIFGLLKKKKIIKKKHLKIISVVYFAILAIVYVNLLKEITVLNIELAPMKKLLLIGFMEVFDFIWFIFGLFMFSSKRKYGRGGTYRRGVSSGFSIGGGSFGGRGSSGGGGSSRRF